ncbi:uncharacterized protein PV09_01997 [Verruconis gallopava]|uniref:Uncharacterized protein n=1 Tax=Verruconis gallopava TaxID=253628 RepID=A0A0D2B7A3_9PEZI|nr:uncharacterized protein PV09_01997 [Verruconis gallopava]KIW07124.1 hypothetical protein PV09_01997 [Verruconis gallopava]
MSKRKWMILSHQMLTCLFKNTTDMCLSPSATNLMLTVRSTSPCGMVLDNDKSVLSVARAHMRTTESPFFRQTRRCLDEPEKQNCVLSVRGVVARRLVDDVFGILDERLHFRRNNPATDCELPVLPLTLTVSVDMLETDMVFCT